MRKKIAGELEPLHAMLGTSDEVERPIRDRAILNLAWSGSSRRRSEVVGLQIGDVRLLDPRTWL